jgi:hypothetical protein
LAPCRNRRRGNCLLLPVTTCFSSVNTARRVIRYFSHVIHSVNVHFSEVGKSRYSVSKVGTFKHFCLFIYDLFNNSVSSPNYIASNAMMANE